MNLQTTDQPLLGKTLVITRSPDQADWLMKTLHTLGAEVILFPTITFRGTEFPKPSLHPQDWMIFTSVQAVHFLLQDPHWVQTLPPLKIISVGPTTTTALAKYGLDPILVPEEYSSDGIIRMLKQQFHHLQGERFILPRSNLAPPDLPDNLKQMGAQVEEWIVYQTECPHNEFESTELIECLSQQHVDMITFTSPSAVHNFQKRLEKSPLPIHNLLNHVTLIALGKTTAQTIVSEWGLEPLIAQTPTSQGLIDTVINFYKDRSTAMPPLTQSNQADQVILKLEQEPGLLQNNWCVPRDTGRFLHVAALIQGAKRICEVGTSIGYSTLWLAKAAQQTGGQIDTLEFSLERQQQAIDHITAADLKPFVQFHLGAALETLEQFLQEGRQFDLAFIDAAKKEYIEYTRLLETLLVPGGVLIADNTHSHREEMLDFLAYIEQSPAFDGAEIHTQNGQYLARKR